MMALSCPFTAAAAAAAAGGGAINNSFRGPPLPLVLVPLVIQLVRASRDPRLTAYLTRLVSQDSEGGPAVAAAAIAANAHVLAQYALSKVPAKVLYWFTARVLNLPASVAMQTTEFLTQSGGRLDGIEEAGVGAPPPPALAGNQLAMVTAGPLPSDTAVLETTTTTTADAADLERRLARLEAQYRGLLEQQGERGAVASASAPSSLSSSSSFSSSFSSLRLPGCASDEAAFSIAQGLPVPIPLSEDAVGSSVQLVKINGGGGGCGDEQEVVVVVDGGGGDVSASCARTPATSRLYNPTTTTTTTRAAVLASQGGGDPFEASSTPQLQEIGLRLGRILLEWAGDTVKQSLVAAAAKSTANQAVVGAGVDLAGRLVDAIVI